jgi:hypothetical protein
MTAALGRAAASLWDSAGRPEDVHPDEFEPDAREALTVALHDPDDPDWLMKVAEEHVSFLVGDEGCECGCGATITDTIEEYAVDLWRQHRADAVRAAIIGADHG